MVAEQKVPLREKIAALATHKNAHWYLFAIALIESVFFPVPPDVLLIPMCILLPTRAFTYAFMATLGSALGGIIGYMVGAFFQDSIGMGIINMYHLQDYFVEVQKLYQEYDLVIVGAAGFSPIPYKVFTLTSGMFDINFIGFVIVSILSRGARFFIISWILWRGGSELKVWIERNLYPITMLMAVALILFVVLMRLLQI